MERVIIRVVVPECSLKEAVMLKEAIDEIAKKVKAATVELSTTPVRTR